MPAMHELRMRARHTWGCVSRGCWRCLRDVERVNLSVRCSALLLGAAKGGMNDEEGRARKPEVPTG